MDSHGPMSGLEKALEIALQAHKSQKDRYGAPYILHPLRMMAALDTEEEMITAVLHDAVEKSHWTLDDLRRQGFSDMIIKAVDCLTRREGESYSSLLERAASMPLAHRVKLADLEDNMNIFRIQEPKIEDWNRLCRFLEAWRSLKK